MRAFSGFLRVLKVDFWGLLLMTSWARQGTDWGNIAVSVRVTTDSTHVAFMSRIRLIFLSNGRILLTKLNWLLLGNLLLCTLSWGIAGKTEDIGEIIPKMSEFLRKSSLTPSLTISGSRLIIWVLNSNVSFLVLIKKIILSVVKTFSTAGSQHRWMRWRCCWRDCTLIRQTSDVASFGSI